MLAFTALNPSAFAADASQSVTVTVTGPPSSSAEPSAMPAPVVQSSAVNAGRRSGNAGGAQVLGSVIRRHLPHTGAGVAGLACFAFVLIAAGSVLTTVSRRRGARSHSRRNRLTSP